MTRSAASLELSWRLVSCCMSPISQSKHQPPFEAYTVTNCPLHSTRMPTSSRVTTAAGCSVLIRSLRSRQGVVTSRSHRRWRCSHGRQEESACLRSRTRCRHRPRSLAEAENHTRRMSLDELLRVLLGVDDARSRDVYVGLFSVDPGEREPLEYAGDSCGASSGERVENQAAWLAPYEPDEPAHERDRLRRRVVVVVGVLLLRVALAVLRRDTGLGTAEILLAAGGLGLVVEAGGAAGVVVFGPCGGHAPSDSWLLARPRYPFPAPALSCLDRKSTRLNS